MADFNRNLSRELIEAAAPQWPVEAKGAAMRKMVAVLNDKLAVMTADIVDFHEKFGLDYKGPPRTLQGELLHFRSEFMAEELAEYVESAEAGDLESQLDAIIDLIYVALGTLYMQGMLPVFAEGWKRVQAANMAKVRCERPGDSKRGTTFDVIKPEGWTAPTHKDLIEKLFAEHGVEPPANPQAQLPL
jgi:predicted HAD superfamily Cof-like phosphohydrolase